MRFNILAFALTFGLWWGVGLFIMTWWILAFGDAAGGSMIERIYIGYTVTPLGSVVGLAWGFVCGTICGGIFAWLYNALAPRVGTNA